MTKILTSGECAQDLRDTCVFLFGAMDHLPMPDILQQGLPIDLSGLRNPLSRMADAVLASGVIAESEPGEWDRFGRWHRVANYITGVIEAVSVDIAESLGFSGKITGGVWLHASIMETLFEQKASFDLRDDDAFVKSWKKTPPSKAEAASFGCVAKAPRVLVVVSGGVADPVFDDGVDVEVFDWDNYKADPVGTSGVPKHFADLAEPFDIPVETGTSINHSGSVKLTDRLKDAIADPERKPQSSTSKDYPSP